MTPAGAALLYALAAVVLAISYGTGPAVLAALVGGVAYHVIFAADADRREWLVPGVLLLIALSAGQVTTRLRRHAEGKSYSAKWQRKMLWKFTNAEGSAKEP